MMLFSQELRGELANEEEMNKKLQLFGTMYAKYVDITSMAKAKKFKGTSYFVVTHHSS